MITTATNDGKAERIFYESTVDYKTPIHIGTFPFVHLSTYYLVKLTYAIHFGCFLDQSPKQTPHSYITKLYNNLAITHSDPKCI